MRSEGGCRGMLYQTGTIRSLMAGVDVGDTPIKTLNEYGDFGLGTFDGVNGEMIVLNGEVWRADGRGILHRAAAEEETPFAVVCRFRPTLRFRLEKGGELSELERDISRRFDSENLIYALHVRGRFSRLHLRSEKRHAATHRPLADVLPLFQTAFSLREVRGDLVGFWFPRYMEAINLPGFHFHFLDAPRRHGGHLFAGRYDSVTVDIMPIFDFGMHLLHTPLFEHVTLSASRSGETEAVEQGEKPNQK